ncbi:MULTISPECIES: hypothetical protein [unclassified Streptomyces]|uniref:hypothetical protein n=1 Tax=unclassified Streptomyces TaxID=2593676 RepID=UPI00227107FF|nr:MULTISPECIES: hypothetical protein [unclassified Streptomyces]MCY0922567.1 hypothetical protein [Streptomyces sp. H27-G5]MCY0962645.1 hypothetical protein [Streptomyces sp. H27-H5]
MTVGKELKQLFGSALTELMSRALVHAGSYAVSRLRSHVNGFDAIAVVPGDRTRAGVLLIEAKSYVREAGRAERSLKRLTLGVSHNLSIAHSTAERLWTQCAFDAVDLFRSAASAGRRPPWRHSGASRHVPWRDADELVRRARECRNRARAAELLLHRELGLIHIEVDILAPVLATSPCGVSRLKSPVVPRPPSVSVLLPAPVIFALAA